MPSHSKMEKPLEEGAIGSILKSSKTEYTVTGKLGYGKFGKIVAVESKLKVFNCLTTWNSIKMVKMSAERGMTELKILRELKKLGAQCHKIIEFEGSFSTDLHVMLIMGTYERTLKKEMGKSKLPLNVIRPIMLQILCGLLFLHKHDFIHGNITLDNIVLVSYMPEEYSIRIINFEATHHPKHNKSYDLMAPTRCYRSPEKLIGYKWLTPSMDIWALGCIGMEMFTGKVCFPGGGLYEMLQFIEKTCGPFPVIMSSTIRSELFFRRTSLGYQLRCVEDFKKRVGSQSVIKGGHNVSSALPLDEYTDPCQDEDDVKVFIQLIKGLLTIDPKMRMTAERAVHSGFFHTGHLGGVNAVNARKIMSKIDAPHEIIKRHNDEPKYGYDIDGLKRL